MTRPFTRIRVIDFETTGFPPHAKPVELGYTDLTFSGDAWYVEKETWSSLINPGIKIPIEAMCVHNITDAMVANAPHAPEVFGRVFRGADYYAAHNVDFDRKFAPASTGPWICTLKAARKIWPDMAKHTNPYLRYALNLDVDPEQAQPAHRAGADTVVTAQLLLTILNEMPLEELLTVSEGKSLPLRMQVGKHKGQLFTAVPSGYLHWITGSDMKNDVKDAARAEIQRRAS